MTQDKIVTEAMLPCPFCGNEPTISEPGPNNWHTWSVSCDHCPTPLQPLGSISEKRADAFAAWNTRSTAQEPALDDDAEKPRRAHVLDIKIGANTLDDLIYALNQTAIDLRMGTISSSGCSGSPSVGFIYDYSVDESWTKERYFAALDRLQSKAPETGEG